MTNPFEIFVDGMRKGAWIAVRNMLPSLMSAFALVSILHTSGILTAIGRFLSPVMLPFALPGEALPVLLTACLTCAGAIGLAAGLAASGSLNADQVAILLPAILLMGSQLQYVGRILIVADVARRHIPFIIGVSVINAVFAMVIMRFIVL